MIGRFVVRGVLFIRADGRQARVTVEVDKPTWRLQDEVVPTAVMMGPNPPISGKILTFTRHQVPVDRDYDLDGREPTLPIGKTGGMAFVYVEDGVHDAARLAREAVESGA